ncbi:MAG TPA: metal-dependent transcriptional regulator [Gemmatimonadaceae bacterium]|nr:metal-dependent transcriptional regulator [Gemmatimonadaceae bacterium]
MTALHEPGALTAPAEDCLKAVYDIERARQGAAVTTNDLAHRLGVAPASVTGMVKRLADQGLVTHEPYHGVRLTDRGRRAALRTLRRHRVIETYLVQALGYPWDRVHDEAERLEHSASDELVDRMAAAIGEPTVDPHGAPIPTREGGIVEDAAVRPLTALAVGDRAMIARVTDEDGDRLRYLGSLRITPGTRIEVVEQEPFGGAIVVRAGGKLRRLAPALAAQVLVSPARD